MRQVNVMTDKIFSLTGKKRTCLLVFLWFITALVMYIIFSFSAQSAEGSKELSQGLLNRILEIIPFEISHVFLRKAAHFSEYALLGAVSFCAFSFTLKRRCFLWGWVLSTVYAVTDEVHQLFIPGRACRAFDVFIDSLGAAAGIAFAALVFFILGLIYKKVKSGKAKSDSAN